MSNHALSQTIDSQTRCSCRRFLGGALAAVATGLLLPASIAVAAERSGAQPAPWIGAATADITPDRSVPLTGYQAVRVSRGILSRCTANVLIAMARDSGGVIGMSLPLTLFVRTRQARRGQPYEGRPQTIPGRIVAGHYDEGGQGVAYGS